MEKDSRNHCAGCIGVIADPRYPGVRFDGSEPRCPGLPDVEATLATRAEHDDLAPYEGCTCRLCVALWTVATLQAEVDMLKREVAHANQYIKSMQDEIAARALGLSGVVEDRDTLKAEVERERMRLAACGTAALGYYKRGKPIAEEYTSASLNDVLTLWEKVEALQAEVERLTAELATVTAERDDLKERVYVA